MLGLQICLAPDRISVKTALRGGYSIASSAAFVGHSSAGAGISELVLKTSQGDELLRAVRDVTRGTFYVTPRLAEDMQVSQSAQVLTGPLWL